MKFLICRRIAVLCAIIAQHVASRAKVELPGEPTQACTNVGHVQADIARLLAYEKRSLGDADAFIVLPMLGPSFRRHVTAEPAQWLLDVGANIGGTSELMLMLFSKLPCVKSNRLHRLPDVGCAQLAEVHVVGVEPIPSTFALLHSRAEKDSWYHAHYVGYPCAIGDTTKESVAVYSTPGLAGDVQASLTRDVVTWLYTQDGDLVPPSHTETHYVQQFSVDYLAGATFNTSSIFLLKSDVEGLDPAVLHGAAESLKKRSIAWLLFEYSSKWEATSPRDPRYTLRGVTSWLFSLGYTCYFVTPTHFIPLYGTYWFSDEVLEIKAWSNIFCGADAAEMSAIVRFYNPSDSSARGNSGIAIAGLHLPPC